MSLAKHGAALAVMLAGSMIASALPTAAAEWLFCIAPSSGERKIYLTALLLSDVPLSVLEHDFHSTLLHMNRRHDVVQCPTGSDERSVLEMRQYAETYNRQRSNIVVTVNWRSSSGLGNPR